jgi:hypothetical protein
MYWALDRGTALEATLTGQITRRNPHRDGLFLTLHDPSGEIECFIRKVHFSADEWESRVRPLRKGDRITASGPVESRTSGGRSQPIVDIRSLTRTLSADLPHLDEVTGTFDSVASGFFLARLKRTVADALLAKGFEELEPRYIHHLRPDGPLEPLEVLFPGYGSPAYLLVSPIPDLRAAAVITGITRAFSVARSYSQTVRDGYTSAESLVIGILMTGTDSKRLVDECIDLVYRSFGSHQTMAANWAEYALVDAWDHQDIPHPSGVLPEISRPTILKHDETACALAWPRPRTKHNLAPQPLLVVESSLCTNPLGIAEGTAIVHIERMAQAISDDITFRR